MHHCCSSFSYTDELRRVAADLSKRTNKFIVAKQYIIMGSFLLYPLSFHNQKTISSHAFCFFRSPSCYLRRLVGQAGSSESRKSPSYC